MLDFEEIIRKPQQALKEALALELNRLGYQTQTKKGFLYAEGEVPVLLVAHLDTVHKEAVRTICYSKDGAIVMSPEGIGGDDRAGVYMILRMVREHRCHVLFCEDEEIGGVGARAFVESGIYPDVNYIVELDRRGSDDAVFYDCDNPEFTRFVTGCGFVERMGTFSDISILAPALKVAAVNISVGYYHEHSRHEFIDLRALEKNIGLVGKMISAKSDVFAYVEAVRVRCGGIWGGRYSGDLLDFEMDTPGVPGAEIKLLMPLPDFAYIMMENGDVEECAFEQYLIDDAGRVYEYLYEYGVAVAVSGCEVRSVNGMAVRFVEKDAVEIEVAPMETHGIIETAFC